MTTAQIVFLDTNVYLHYKRIDQVDWLVLLNAKSVRIVVPPTVLRELNRAKDSHSQPQIRERADSVIHYLLELFRSSEVTEVRKGVEVQLWPDDPLIDFGHYHLSPQVQDDHLIGSIIAYQRENAGEEVVLLTSDAGILLMGKARRQGIRTLSCPEDLKLPVAPNLDQIRIRELESQLNKLKNRLPKVSLAFASGSQRTEFKLTRMDELSEQEIQRAIEKIKLEHPKKELQPPDKRDDEGYGASLRSLMAAIDPSNTISQADITSFNESLEQYYERCGKYLVEKRAYDMVRARTIRIDLQLVNEGTAPAEDVDIFMHFPNGFVLMDEDAFPEPPRVPQPPAAPKSAMQKLLDEVNYSPFLDLPYNLNMPDVSVPPNVSSPSITRTNSYDVQVNVQKIKHSLSEKLDPMFAIFDTFEGASSFTINYGIITDSLPDKVSGILHVRISK